MMTMMMMMMMTSLFVPIVVTDRGSNAPKTARVVSYVILSV